MRRRHGEWAVQPRAEYARRVLKFTGLCALAQPRVYWLFARLLSATGRDLDGVVSGAVKGFPKAGLAQQIRRRPSAPLLALLERRLRRFDAERLQSRARAGDRLAAVLPPTPVRPGADAKNPTYWVFPVRSRQRGALIAALRRAGFDAATGASSIATIPPPEGRPDLRARSCERLMAETVFLPAYPELGDRELARLGTAVALALHDER